MCHVCDEELRKLAEAPNLIDKGDRASDGTEALRMIEAIVARGVPLGDAFAFASYFIKLGVGSAPLRSETVGEVIDVTLRRINTPRRPA